MAQLNDQFHTCLLVDYCSMASSCTHGDRKLCASSVDGCEHRTFLDSCDMYEYNCDNQAEFKESECEEEKEASLEDVAETTDEGMEPSNAASDEDVIVKLDLAITTKREKLKLCGKLGGACGRPRTWATTEKGETRDFFRILTDN